MRSLKQDNNVEAFFQEFPFPSLSLFDARRGSLEGQEVDKVLGFHPAWSSTHVRTSLVGLAQALTSFSASFGTVSCCVESKVYS